MERFSSRSMDHPLPIGDDSERIEGVTDVVVLDSPSRQRLEDMPLTSETIGETSGLPTTPMKVTDGSSKPMNDANMESLHGDLLDKQNHAHGHGHRPLEYMLPSMVLGP